MGNFKNNPFNRREYLHHLITQFVQSESNGFNEVSGKLNLLNRDPQQNTTENLQKRKILETCLALFTSQKFKEQVRKEKADKGIEDLNTVSSKDRLENLHKIEKYAENLTNKLVELVLGDLKRKYNMSSKCTSNMLKSGSPVRPIDVPNGLIKTGYDDFGVAVTIQHIGTLFYDTNSSDEFIYKYRVEKHLSADEKKTYEIFSTIDLNKFDEDLEYQHFILQELLSENNLEFSNAKGYVGELRNTSKSPRQLKVGTELEDDDYYRYQVSSKYSLEYDGTVIEAINAYNRQEAEKIEKNKQPGIDQSR